MNTPTPTEAHYDLRRQVIFSDPDAGAQLIAASEARATAELRDALALGQENCDDVYDELRVDCDELRADVVRLTAERDQLRAKAQRFQRLEAFTNTAAAELKGGLITFGGIAGLRAERDQLRAENATLRSAQKACEACDEPTAFEVRQLRDQLAAAQQREAIAIASWDEERNRALREGERVVEWRDRAERAEAELAVERARLDAGTILLTVAGERVWHCGVDLRAAIDAGMREGAK